MKYKLLLLANLFTWTLSAQTQKVEMADQFRADGKIYVVLAVVLIILVGLFAYLIVIDKRLKRMENEFEDQQNSTRLSNPDRDIETAT